MDDAPPLSSFASESSANVALEARVCAVVNLEPKSLSVKWSREIKVLLTLQQNRFILFTAEQLMSL